MQETGKIKIGDEIIFFEGRDGKNVAYNPFGKVILCVHDIPLGYAKVKKVVAEKERVILVKAQHIIRDLYSGITYDDFIKVLPKFSYKIGFDREFKNTLGGVDTMEHHIYAYNMNTGAIINACTITSDLSHKQCFDEISVYLPNVPAHNNIRHHGYVRGGQDLTVFDFANSYHRYDILKDIDNILYLVDHSFIDRYWSRLRNVTLTTYMDDFLDREYSNVRLKLAPESLKLFKNCEFLYDILSEEEILKIREEAKNDQKKNKLFTS